MGTATAQAVSTRPLMIDAPENASVDQLAINTIRFLAADMVQAANSGHPGLPMGAAPMAWTLFSRHLRHDPADPAWPDRDRFVLSAGHGSALLYALLHLFGYGVSTADLQQFRQLGSVTPGHPEVGHTPGVETTTGPLGQGVAMAVGLALAERMQAARYCEITDHYTYVLAGDGCLMEGVSHEAASLAGQLGLGRLIVLWDDNDITIDGPVTQSSGDDQRSRFAAYGWHTVAVADGTDVAAIDAAITQAKADPRPSLIAVRTVIGQGAPGIEGTSAAHGAPLGPAVLEQAKQRAGFDYPAFAVPDEVAQATRAYATAGASAHAQWAARFAKFAAADPARAETWRRTWAAEAPAGLAATLAAVPRSASRATRVASQAMLAAVAEMAPELVGGSADLAGSTGTAIGGEVITAGDYAGTVVHAGIREFGMAALLNGLSLHGGFRAYGSTFLVFSDYLRPAIRLSALMKQPVTYILTHDSVAVGEDGPTHQPIEHVESLRLIPGLQVIRPADDLETAAAWQLAVQARQAPTALILSRQSLPLLPAEDEVAAHEAVLRDGARVVRDVPAPAVEIVASGSEVSLALAAADLLDERGLPARVVSVPWRERWATSAGARRTVPRVAVEAGVRAGWAGFADVVVGLDEFGASGKGDQVLAHFGFTPEAVADAAASVAAQS
ncbi:MAG: transketolase [Nostocoides sp.]